MGSDSGELTLEKMLAEPIVQLVMKSDGIVGDDVRRLFADVGAARGHRKSIDERGTPTPPDRSTRRASVRTTIAGLFRRPRLNAVQKDLNGRAHRLLRFFFGWWGADPENDLEMEVVADHTNEVPGYPQAVVRPDFASLVCIFQDLGEPDRGPTRPFVIERFHECREAVGFRNDDPVNADHCGGHVEVHEMPAEPGQRLPQASFADILDHQGRQHLVCVPRDDGRKQTLLVAELIVDVPFRSSRALDDRIDAGRRVALLEKDRGSGLQKGFPTVLGSTRFFRHHCLFTSFTTQPLDVVTGVTIEVNGNVRYRRARWPSPR